MRGDTWYYERCSRRPGRARSPPVLVGQNVLLGQEEHGPLGTLLPDEADRLRREALAARPWYRRLWDSIFGGAEMKGACGLGEAMAMMSFGTMMVLAATVLLIGAVGFCYTAIREWLDDRIHRKEYLRKGGN